MSYVKPEDVKSPQPFWRLHRVLREGVEDDWAAAEGQWKDGDEVWRDRLAIRWNGSPGWPLGNPQSSGHATWFIVPNELEEAARKAIASLTWASEIDALMIQGITWDDLIKKGKALAERMGYGAPVTHSTLKAHAKYRGSQKSWKVIKMTKTEVQIEKVKT